MRMARLAAMVTSWKINEDENNSYFVISDTTTEWIYNAESDMIHRRGSTESFSRGIPRPTPKPTTNSYTYDHADTTDSGGNYTNDIR